MLGNIINCIIEGWLTQLRFIHAMKYNRAKEKIAQAPYDLVHEDFKGNVNKRYEALYIICQQYMHKIG